MDPGRAPQRVFPAHPLDEITQTTINLWPPCLFRDFQRQKALNPAAKNPCWYELIESEWIYWRPNWL